MAHRRPGRPGSIAATTRRALTLALALGVVAASNASFAAAPDRATAHGPAARAAAALRSGHYEEARRWGDAGGRRLSGPAATLVAARAEIALGLYAQARERLQRAVDKAPADLPLRQALCELFAQLGDRAALDRYVQLTYDHWAADWVDQRKTDDLLAVAAIMRLDDNWQDATDTLRRAVRVDPHDPRPNVFLGQLFLEEQFLAEADTSFRAALAADPTNPDAHVGLADVHLRRRYDVAAAESELAAALRVNSRHAGALALRAAMAMDGEDFAGAAALIGAIRSTNPRDPGAAWLAAARARLLGDQRGYERERDAHAAIHPRDGDFFAATADMLNRQRRTEDARAVAEEGAAVDPSNTRCQSVLGTALLRLANEAEGIAALRGPPQRNPAAARMSTLLKLYDERTSNLLQLYDKVIPGMQTVTTKHLSFRIDPAARVAVEKVVAPFLEETYGRYVVKFGFEPRGPVVFELYGNPDHFATRTAGIPGIGLEAVSFGRVIASRSATSGTTNWGMVLAHELAQVFARELSRSRAPRWFSEGLAELETMRARPEWNRHAERNLWGAMYRGELASLGQLSNDFVRARNAEEATRAHAESALALDFLEGRFGFGRLREALVRFGAGGQGLEVVAAATGDSTEQLEQGFHAFVVARGTAFDHQYLPAETLRASDSAATTQALRAPASRAPRPRADHPADTEAKRALAAVRAGDTATATRALDRARAVPRGSQRRAVVFATGELALALGNADQARAAFLRLLAPPRLSCTDGAATALTSSRDAGEVTEACEAGDGGDGYDVRIRLARAEIRRGALPAAETHLRRAMAFDPGSAEATGLMVELLGDPAWHGSRDEDRLRAIHATLRLEPSHAGLARELVLGLARRGRLSEVIEAAQLAIFIEPGLPDLHAALGRALAQTGQPHAAAAALECALALGSDGKQQAELRQLLQAVKLADPPGRQAAAARR